MSSHQESMYTTHPSVWQRRRSTSSSRCQHHFHPYRGYSSATPSSTSWPYAGPAEDQSRTTPSQCTSSFAPHDWLQPGSHMMPNVMADPQGWEVPSWGSHEGVPSWTPHQSWVATPSMYAHHELQPGSGWMPVSEMAPPGLSSPSFSHYDVQSSLGWTMNSDVTPRSWAATPSTYSCDEFQPDLDLPPITEAVPQSWGGSSSVYSYNEPQHWTPIAEPEPSSWGTHSPSHNAQIPGAAIPVQTFATSSPPVPERLLPGVLVPQETYATGQKSKTHAPIRFNLANSEYAGVRVADLSGETPNLGQLIDGESLFPYHDVRSLSLRILWPGCAQWKRTIATLNWKTEKREPKTRAKIAQEVCKAIRKALEDHRADESRADGGRWDPRRIHVDRLFLVEFRHASKNTWQPVICMQQ